MLDLRPSSRLHPVEAARPSIASLLWATWTLARRHPLVVLVGAMLTLDAAFIIIQVAVDATDYGFPGAFRLSLETEAGVAQFYGWAKAGAAAALLAVAWQRFRAPSAAAWAAALAYLGIDDALAVHEGFGSALANTFSLPGIGSLRAQDVGELVAYLVIGIIALGVLLVGEVLDPSGPLTMLSALMAPLAAAFVFFAVVLDVLGGMILPSVLEIAVEDGGELVLLTGLFVAAVIWTQQPDELADLARS